MSKKVKQFVKQIVKKSIKSGAPNGIRIHVAGLKGRCPRPLDDGGVTPSIAKKMATLQYGLLVP